MNTRIKELRKCLGLKQNEFAKNIMLTQGHLSDIENGRKILTNKNIELICNKFDVNENWLRYGIGDIFVKPSSNIISDLTRKYALDEIDKKIMIEFARLNPNERQVFKKFLNRLSNSDEIAATNDTENNIIEFNEANVIVDDEKDIVQIRVYMQPASAGRGNYLSDDDGYETKEFNASDVPWNADYGVYITGNSMEPDINDTQIVFIREQSLIDSGKIGIFILNGESYCKELKIDRKNRCLILISHNEDYKDIYVKETDDFRTIGLVVGVF